MKFCNIQSVCKEIDSEYSDTNRSMSTLVLYSEYISLDATVWLEKPTFAERLTFTIFWANSADDKLVIFFSYFSQKTAFVISCKLFPMETICMKCQILFPGKNKKNTSKYRLPKILPSVRSI